MSGKVVIKTINVKSKNVVVQIPRFMMENWNLKEGDFLDVVLNDDGDIVLTPRKRDPRKRANELFEKMRGAIDV